jgi:serine/threonine-protein kinase HipA
MKCHGCFKKTRSDLFCPRCKKELFGGVNVKPLDFDKETFYKTQTEMAGRLSISGVQDKISLRLERDRLVPTERDGHYILKPVPATDQIEHKEAIAANEHICMQISRRVFNISTALSALIPFSDGELAYITRRFDYAKDGTKLDQEDFASVLNLTEDRAGRNFKYEGSYEEVARALKKYVPASLPALEDFYMRIIFNYLIANGDAHLKNFSLYRPEGRKDYALTPSYDLLFTRYHVKELTGDMGLDLFKDTETRSFGAIGSYTLEDFEVFADLIGLPEKRVAKLFTKIISSVPEVTALVKSSFLDDEAKEQFIENYTARLKKRLLPRTEIEKPIYQSS